MPDFVWEYIGNQRGRHNQSRALQQKRFVNPVSDTSVLDIKNESERLMQTDLQLLLIILRDNLMGAEMFMLMSDN